MTADPTIPPTTPVGELNLDDQPPSPNLEDRIQGDQRVGRIERALRVVATQDKKMIQIGSRVADTTEQVAPAIQQYLLKSEEHFERYDALTAQLSTLLTALDRLTRAVEENTKSLEKT